MVCPSCGAPASEHSPACPSCGAALTQTPSRALGWGPPHPAARVEVPWGPPTPRAAASPSPADTTTGTTTDTTAADTAAAGTTAEWSAAGLVWDAHDATVVDLTGADTTRVPVTAEPVLLEPVVLEPVLLDPVTGDPVIGFDGAGFDLGDTPAGGLVWDTQRFDLGPEVVARHSDVDALPSRRRSMALLTLAVLASAASVLTCLVAVVGFDVRSEVNGRLSLKANDFSSNSIVGCIIVAVLMVAGAAAAAAGRRLGAGVAAGAGCAGAGLLLWIDGQGLAVLDSISSGLHEKGVSYRLATTLDIGFWTALAAAGLSLAVVAAAWGWRTRDGRQPHHPAIGVFGAFATLVMVAGLMLPVGGAALVDNFSSDRPVNAVRFGKAFVFYLLAVDHQPQPPVTWLLRLALLVLLLVAGLVAFLKGTRFGVGIALGVLPLQLWLWATSALQAGDRPFSIAGGNPGGSGFESHLVTTIGVMMSVVALAIALVAAFAVSGD